MTDHDPSTPVRTLLERVPDTPPPVQALLAAGEGARRARRTRLAAVGAAASVVVVAVASLLVGRLGEPVGPDPTLPGEVDLAGRWDVVELWDGEGRRVDLVTDLPGPVTIRFDPTDQGIVGSDGCNAFFGHYRAGEGRLVVRDIGFTEVGCRPDMVLVPRLRTVVTPRETEDGLALLDADGRPVVTLARALPSLDGQWEVRRIAATTRLPAYAADATAWPDVVVVHFGPRSDGTVYGDTGCNSSGGAYLQRGATLRAAPGTLMTSLVGCPFEPAIHEVLREMRLATSPDDRTLLLRDAYGRVLAELRRPD